MVQVLVQLDDETARRLERVAPGRSRKRSEFVRIAIVKELAARQELATEAAYRRAPDDVVAFFEPRVWEPKRKKSPARAKKP